MQLWALHPASHHDMRMDRHSVSGETAGQTEKTPAGSHSHLASFWVQRFRCVCVVYCFFSLGCRFIFSHRLWTRNPQPGLMMIDGWYLQRIADTRNDLESQWTLICVWKRRLGRPSSVWDGFLRIFLSDPRGSGFQGDKTSKKPVYHSKPRIFMSAGVLDDVYLLENQAKSGA